MNVTREIPGSTRVPRVGFGVPAETNLAGRVFQGGALASGDPSRRQELRSGRALPAKVREGGDAFANTRDACAPRILSFALTLLLALLPSAHGTEADTFSPVVSYQFLDSLATPDTSTTISSPVVSYQFFDWIGDDNVTFQNSAEVSYFFDDRFTTPVPGGFSVAGSGLELFLNWNWTGTTTNALRISVVIQKLGATTIVEGYPVNLGSSALSMSLTGLEPGTSYRVTVKYTGAADYHDTEAAFDFTTSGLPRNVVSVTGSGTANENGPRSAKFVIARAGAATNPLRVFFHLGGVALNAVDYQGVPSSAVIPAGAKSATVTIIPILDSLGEGTEDVTLTLLPGAGYSLGRTGLIAAVPILDASANKFIQAKSFALKDGSINRWNFPKQTFTTREMEHWYRVTVDAPVALNVTATGPYVADTPTYLPADGSGRGPSPRTIARRLQVLRGNIGVELMDATGTLIGEPSDEPGFAAEFLRRRLLPSAGSYYIRVYFSGSRFELPFGGLKYLLMVSGGDNWDLITGTVPGAFASYAEAHHVGVFRAPGTTPPASATSERWIVTHGRDDHPGTFLDIAKGVKSQRPTAEALLLDWSTAADSIGVGFGSGFWFDLIGIRLGTRLARRDGQIRFAGNQVNTVGHSWGTYVNQEVAKVLFAGNGTRVARMVALDPALDAGNYPVGDQAFGDYSDYSLGFWSSVFGSVFTTLTCADSFDLEVTDSGNPLVRHNAAHQVFLGMLSNTDAISAEIQRALFDSDFPIWLRGRNRESLNKRLHYKGPLIDDSPFGTSTPDGFEGNMTVQTIGGKRRAWEMFFHPR